MKFHDLSPAPGSKTKSKRVGRGTGSGKGKTSGRGMKGQNSRSGGGVRPGFEGGQNPLIRRLPKRGFTNIFRKEYAIVNIKSLENFEEGTIIDEKLLLDKKIIGKKMPYGIKILGQGELKVALTIRANKFSKSAKESIEKAGGKVEVL